MKSALKYILFITLFSCFSTIVLGQKQIKNVIVMIPDGTSTSLLSIARYYQQYLDSNCQSLSLDPYLCGLVRTHSSDTPIGDSAPTTSCYMTGQPSQAGFVSTYPAKTCCDLIPIDATRTYQPLATLFEAARIKKNMATGLVFTCEFPHATPADCVAHFYDRSNYDVIVPQMVHNKIDIVIGGGASLLQPQWIDELKNNQYEVLVNNKKALIESNSPKLWSLFSDWSMPYEIERDTNIYPSLAQMTQKAIKLLSTNNNGFILLVEGSKVDWAAHDNDAKTAIIELLAFDKAVKVAIDFAKKDGETLVLILPDHGTGGINIGNNNLKGGYGKYPLKRIMDDINKYSISIASLADKLNNSPLDSAKNIFLNYCNISLADEEILYLNSAKNYKSSTLSKQERKNNLSIEKIVSQLLYSRTAFGFTTFGHTGEDVFLACYHPNNQELKGHVSNIDVNHYLCQQLQIPNMLNSLTQEIFVPDGVLFNDTNFVKKDSIAPNRFRLTVEYNGHILETESYTNKAIIDGQNISLNSLIIYMPKNRTFYLPKSIMTHLQ